MTPRDEMEAALEAILFVSGEPVPRERLLSVFGDGEEEQEQAAAALETVLERYRGGERRGVMVDEAAGGIRLATRPEMGGWLRRFFEVRGGQKLSMAALETLAIIAYRQPITAPEIQELRGVNPSGVLKTLLERRLIRIAGRKEVVGNPFLYRTSREFLVHFGLASLKELPPLEDFEELLGEAMEGDGGGQASDEGDGDEGDVDKGGGGSPEMTAETGGEDREEKILRQVADLDEADEADEPEEAPEAQEAQGA